MMNPPVQRFTVITFYTMDIMMSILIENFLPELVFFVPGSALLKKYKFILRGVALRIVTCPLPFQGRLFLFSQKLLEEAEKGSPERGAVSEAD